MLGAAGGVGMAAIDLAKAHGARVVAAASSPEKVEACSAAGADIAIDYSDGDLKAAIREAAAGLARFLGADTRFGAQLDSLADLVSFGVAPGVLIYMWSLSRMGTAGWVAAMATPTSPRGTGP